MACWTMINFSGLSGWVVFPSISGIDKARTGCSNGQRRFDAIILVEHQVHHRAIALQERLLIHCEHGGAVFDLGFHFRAQVKSAMCLMLPVYWLPESVESICAPMDQGQESIDIRVGSIKITDCGCCLGCIFTFDSQHISFQALSVNPYTKPVQRHPVQPVRPGG